MIRENLASFRARQRSSAGFVWRRAAFTLAAAILAFMALVPMHVSAAVTISSFTAKANAPQIDVSWKTATEINNSGFNLLRSTTQDGSYAKIAGLIAAKNPGSITGASYSYSDSSITAGQTYYYKLEGVESSGGTQQFGPVSASLPQAASPTPTSTSAPAATSTPTSAPAATNTSVAASTSTPVSSSASTSVPAATQPSSPGVAGSKPSPTRVTKIAQAAGTATRSPGSKSGMQNVPPPAGTLVAIGIKQPTPEPDMADAETDVITPTDDGSAVRDYYVRRLVVTGLLFGAGALAFGAIVLSSLAVVVFLRATLR